MGYTSKKSLSKLVWRSSWAPFRQIKWRILSLGWTSAFAICLIFHYWPSTEHGDVCQLRSQLALHIYGMCMQLGNCGVEIHPLGKHLASVGPAHRDWLTNTYQISPNPPQHSSSDELNLEIQKSYDRVTVITECIGFRTWIIDSSSWPMGNIQ